MANLNTCCPGGWAETSFSKRTCGRLVQAEDSCSVTSFSLNMGNIASYSRICGRIKAYAYGSVDAFANFQPGMGANNGITDPYVSGVILTAGAAPDHTASMDICSRTFGDWDVHRDTSS